MSVTDAVRKNIALLSEFDASVGESAEAALAVSLAERIDDASNSATSVSMNAGRLLDAMAAVRSLAPEVRKVNPLDEIRARRDRKLDAGLPEAAVAVRSRGRGKPS